MAGDDVATLFVLAFFALVVWGFVKLARRPKRYAKRFTPMEAADRHQRNRWFHKSRYGLSDEQWIRGRSVPTARGDVVRSRAEARVADHLHGRGFRYEYEPMVCGFRPDFFLPDYGIVIEYWSPLSKNRRVKTAAYLREGYGLVSLEDGKGVSVERDIDRQLYYRFRDVGLAPDGRTKRSR